MPKPIESIPADHSSLWRGQLFLFDKPSAQSWSPIQGITLLGLVALLELLLRPIVGFALQGTGFKNAHWHQAIFRKPRVFSNLLYPVQHKILYCIRVI